MKVSQSVTCVELMIGGVSLVRASETEQETVEHRAQVTGSIRLKGALANETEQETIEH